MPTSFEIKKEAKSLTVAPKMDVNDRLDQTSLTLYPDLTNSSRVLVYKKNR